MRYIQVRVSDDLHADLSHECIDLRMTLQELVEGILKSYIITRKEEDNGRRDDEKG